MDFEPRVERHENILRGSRKTARDLVIQEAEYSVELLRCRRLQAAMDENSHLRQQCFAAGIDPNQIARAARTFSRIQYSASAEPES